MLTKAIEKQLDAFLSGFHELIPRELISVFSEREMELLICGLPEVDIADLRANTDYRGWVGHHNNQSDPLSNQTIQWFWQVLQEFDQQEKALFVQLYIVIITIIIPITITTIISHIIYDHYHSSSRGDHLQ